jgi:hypothetical protein
VKEMAMSNISKVVLLAVLILSSQFMFSHGTTPANGVTDGAVSPPTEGGGSGVVTEDDPRPSIPGHSPGIGHSFVNNKLGRRLLADARC